MHIFTVQIQAFGCQRFNNHLVSCCVHELDRSVTQRSITSPAGGWRGLARRSSANVATLWLHTCLIFLQVSPPVPNTPAIETSTSMYPDIRKESPIKAHRPLMHDTLNAPWLLTNRQFQWTGNGHSQLPMAEFGKSSPNIDLLHTTGSNGRAWTIFTIWAWTLTYDLDLQSHARLTPMPKIKVKGQTLQTGECPQQTDTHAHTRANGRTRTHMDATKRR